MVSLWTCSTKNDHSEVPFLSKSAPFIDVIVVSNEVATKLLKGLNPSKALGEDADLDSIVTHCNKAVTDTAAELLGKQRR